MSRCENMSAFFWLPILRISSVSANVWFCLFAATRMIEHFAEAFSLVGSFVCFVFATVLLLGAMLGFEGGGGLRVTEGADLSLLGTMLTSFTDEPTVSLKTIFCCVLSVHARACEIKRHRALLCRVIVGRERLIQFERVFFNPERARLPPKGRQETYRGWGPLRALQRGKLLSAKVFCPTSSKSGVSLIQRTIT